MFISPIVKDYTMQQDWWQLPQTVQDYLGRADGLPHRKEGEAVLLDLLPASISRVLDLGTGNGRLIGLVKTAFPHITGIGLDFSPVMVDAFRERYVNDPAISLVVHNMEEPLPAIEPVDAVVSSFAIHHLEHPRKRALYAEIFACLVPGGVFCNLEHVASPTEKLHDNFLARIGRTRETEDRANKLLDVETQLGWLRQIGFQDVDCFWKWREFALIGGTK